MNVFSRSRGALECLCRHPSKHHRHNHAPGKHNPTKKKRDISTSFRKGCIPRPLVNTTHTSHEEEDELILGIPPPAAAPPSAAGSTPSQPLQLSALQAAQASTGLSLGEPCRTSRASTAEPVIAAAALAAPLVLTAQDLGLSLQDDPATGSSSSSSSDEDSADGLWAEDPLASFDRVLDGLLVAPTLPQAFTPASPPSRPAASPSSSLTLSSLLEALPVASTPTSAAPAPAPQQGRAGVQEGVAASTSSSSSGSKKKSSSSSSKGASSKALRQKSTVPCAAAAAAPAVTVIHSEAEYERELQAAAALQQLLVVKVESSHHLLQGALDPSLRFQTHTNLPTPLNTYLPHNDLGHSDFGPSSAPFGFLGGAGGGSGAAGSSPSSTAEVLASMGIPLGPIPASNGSHSHGMGGLGGLGAPSSSLFGAAGAGSSSSGEPFSPVHAWYKQLAAQYAHSAAAEGRTSPVRFLSLQSDQGAARAVARRLGVSSPLAVVLVDPASGRKLQEVCGAKIEQELPNGLLYFAGSDAQGARPTEQLAQVNTQADFEALKSSSPLAVMAFHIHAAPPCVRSYARMHGVAQQYAGAGTAAAPRVSFGVMDVDAAAEGAAVSSGLGVGQFPTYVIFRDGQEVARLSSSPDRRKLGEVLAQHAAEAAAGKE